MKSREYRNVVTGNIYWLEGDAVMVRHHSNKKESRSLMSAKDFFIGVGNDMLVLVEESK